MVKGKQTIRKVLHSLYYNEKGPAGYSRASVLYKEARKRLKSKVKLKDVKEFLLRQPAHTLHRVPRRKFKRRKTISLGVNEYWQCDLAEMEKSVISPNDGVRYWLVIIDTYSRYAYAEVLFTKTGYEVSEAFEKVMFRENVNNLPKNLSTDWGTEFHNSYFKNLMDSWGINFYSTQNFDTKAAIAERFIRTLKSRVYKYMTRHKRLRYVDKLQDIVDGYNSSYHTSIKMSPREMVAKSSSDGYITIVQSGDEVNAAAATAKYGVGDKVRLAKVKRPMDKSYRQRFTTEIFTISKVLTTQPVTYHVKDMLGETIIGAFYADELQLVK